MVEGGWGEQRMVAQAWEHLEGSEKASLQDEMNEIDLERVASIVKRCTTQPEEGTGAVQFSPLPTIRRVSHREEYEKWETQGLKAIGQGQVAVVLLAGGQGSRLGYEHPKGMFSFGLPSGKSLFQLQAERIQNLRQRSQTQGSPQPQLPWYIMTSDATYEETVAFFEEKELFGLPREDVKFFKQSKLPATTPDGQILMESPSAVSIATPRAFSSMFLSSIGDLSSSRW